MTAAEFRKGLGRRSSGGPPSRPEQDLVQRPLIRWLRHALPPEAFALHIPNGGARSPQEAAILSGLGVMPGAADILIVWNSRCLFVECKAPGESCAPRGDQFVFSERCTRAGVPYGVFDDWARAARWVAHLIPVKVPPP
jgi:hypothetical protein